MRVRRINFFNFNVQQTSNGCPARLSPRDQNLVSLTIPIWLFLLLLATSLIHRLIDGCHPRIPIYRSSMYQRTVWELAIFSYSHISATGLKFLQCTDLTFDPSIGGTVSVVLTSPAIQCFSAEWNEALPVVIPIVVIDVIGLPLLIAWSLCRKFPEQHDPRLYLTEAYSQRSAKSWEALCLLRRALLVVIDVLFTPSAVSHWRGCALSIFVVICYTGQLLVEPYHSPLDNRLESVALFLLFVCSMILTFAGRPYGTGSHIFIVGVLMVPTAFLVAFTIQQYCRDRSKKYQFDHDGLIDDMRREPFVPMVHSKSSIQSRAHD
jgi:hypothetical protein